jgi:copper homeostasis protein
VSLVIEGCVESLEAAQAAEQGGAHRIELCTNLAVGGTTPAIDLVAACVSRLKIPVFVMVRPRGGDFCYSAAEHAQMLNEIKRVKDAGGHGIVTGALRADASLDETQTRALIGAARPLPVTFHRAFDACDDVEEALEVLIALGAARVLTSGGAATAPEGAAKIAQLVRRAAGRIGILAGGGINGDNVAALVRTSGVREVHFSTKDAAKVQRVALSLDGC